MPKIQNFLIPYQKYYIDSGRFFIDSDKFLSVNIPENCTTIDSDTGEPLREFKNNSLEIPYGSHHIYISNVKKVLKQGTINKVLIYFSPKIFGANYFNGIQKHNIIEVLEFLKEKGRLIFDNVNDVFKEIYVKDLDIKCDYKRETYDRIKIAEYYKILKESRFNGQPIECTIKDNFKFGFGLWTYHRKSHTIAKPYIKFYDKSRYFIDKDKAFFDTFPNDLKNEIMNNFILRYEYTLRDKTFFSKFGLTNRLEDLLEVSNEKWREIGNNLLDINFQIKIKKQRDLSKLTPNEKIMSMMLLVLKEDGHSITEIKNMFIVPQTSTKARYRSSLTFEKIYQITALDNAREIQINYEQINYWDKLFGFI